MHTSGTLPWAESVSGGGTICFHSYFFLSELDTLSECSGMFAELKLTLLSTQLQSETLNIPALGGKVRGAGWFLLTQRQSENKESEES